MLTEISYTHRDWESQRSVTLFVSLMTISPTLSHSLQNIKHPKTSQTYLSELSYLRIKNITYFSYCLFFSFRLLACPERQTTVYVSLLSLGTSVFYSYEFEFSYLSLICLSVIPSPPLSHTQDFSLTISLMQDFSLSRSSLVLPAWLWSLFARVI